MSKVFNFLYGSMIKINANYPEYSGLQQKTNKF